MRITFERALDDQEDANKMKMGCERWLAGTPTTDKVLDDQDDANEIKMGCERWLAGTPTTDKVLHSQHMTSLTETRR